VEELGWNSQEDLIKVPTSQKPLKVVIAMEVRWWSDIDQDTRYILLEEFIKPSLKSIRDEMKKKADKAEKREMLKISDRDMDTLRKMVPILYPVKKAIKELEGPFPPYFK
jgi:hypothetical protein